MGILKWFVLAGAVASIGCNKHPTDAEIAKAKAEIAASDEADKGKDSAIDARLNKALAAIDAARPMLAAAVATATAAKAPKPAACPADVLDQVTPRWNQVAVIGDPEGLAWLAKPPEFARDDHDSPSDPPWTNTPSGAMTEFANLSWYLLLKAAAEKPPPAGDTYAEGRRLRREKLGRQLDDFTRDYPAARLPPRFVGVYLAKVDGAGEIVEPDPFDKKADPKYRGGASTGRLLIVDPAKAKVVCVFKLLAFHTGDIKTHDPSTALASDLGQKLVDVIDGTLPKGWYAPKSK